MKKWFFLLSVLLITSVQIICQTIPVQFTINARAQRHAISPYIYGTNQNMAGSERFTVFRQGGNRMTGYNWENNFSNAGSDWYHSSDNYLTWVVGIPSSQERIPGIVVTRFAEQNSASGAKSLVTLQMAGYVARDGRQTVTEAQTAPSVRWREVKFRKQAPFSLNPDTTDAFVYMDEQVHFLINRFGLSTEGGIWGYSLDNEPALWPFTHPRIHPAIPTYREISDKGIILGHTIKQLDPGALVFGPVLYGISAYIDFQGAPDKSTEGSGYDWFISYYLHRMKQASDTCGIRLLDVLDLHWYPEARGDNRITDQNATTPADIQARLQAPRTLWDTGYYENSWIGQWRKEYLPLIPVIKKSIDTYYPGTKLAFTEYTYGGGDHISGGLAQADVLGIFGRYGIFAAMHWLTGPSDYISSGFRLYRNYDGAGGAFGDTSIFAATSDKVNSSVYASVTGPADSSLHIVVINKSAASSISGTFSITAETTYPACKIWGMNKNSTSLYYAGSYALTGNSFTITIPALTAYHIVLDPGFEVSSQFYNTGNSLRIYPVPATGEVYIEMPANVRFIRSARLISPDGRICFLTSDMFTAEQNRIVLQTEKINLPSGLYIVDFDTPDGRLKGKLLLQEK